jgi:diguanylate cyclase
VVRFGVAIVDLDEFKKFNLSHGLTCGDAALRGVAEQLVRTRSARRADIARYDGDAFAILLECSSSRELADSAEALHRAVANFRTSENLRVSASIGVAHTRIGEAAEALLMRAEQALYLAKQFGRNRVEISNSAAPLRVDGAVIPMRRSA